MATGTVKWFNGQKGFGFIQPDNGGSDVFVHISAVERAGLGTIHEGQKLSYELEKTPRQRQDVRRATASGLNPKGSDRGPPKLPTGDDLNGPAQAGRFCFGA